MNDYADSICATILYSPFFIPLFCSTCKSDSWTFYMSSKVSTFGTQIPSIILRFYFWLNNDLISWVYKSSRAGAFVLGVINTFSEFFAFCLINGKN